MTTILTSHRTIPTTVDERGNFQAVVGDEDHLTSFHLADLKEKIDAYLKAKGKSRVFDLPVINRQNETAIITGIHLGTSVAMTKPALGGSSFYVDTPFARSRVQALIALNLEQRGIMADLKELTVKSGFGHGRMKADDVERRHDELSESYEAAKTTSNRMNETL